MIFILNSNLGEMSSYEVSEKGVRVSLDTAWSNARNAMRTERNNRKKAKAAIESENNRQ